ncbi:arginine deiminase family protein [Puia sp. P3]|uniref:arginine deiminase family protein n=1 Tax=Puia sp. P3 TaxID=3423952 RepID=UPI003D672B4B
MKLVASVCAIEACSYETQQQLQQLDSVQLAKTFISGSLTEDQMLFAPIPNFIFTRDIGIVINNHVLLNKPAKKARTREALLAKYIFFNHPLFAEYQDRIIELADTHHHFLLPREGDDRKVTLEGGDVMVVSKDHLLIGVSERTSTEAAYQCHQGPLRQECGQEDHDHPYSEEEGLYAHRYHLHTDTPQRLDPAGDFFQKGHETRRRRRGTADPRGQQEGRQTQDHPVPEKDPGNPEYFDNLEDLLSDISKNDLECTEKVKFIYSGNNEFPFDAREQWTDSCNLLALKEGVVLSYDRNDKTVEAFKENGFAVVHAEDLIREMEEGRVDPGTLEYTLVLMPSAELSRARGGFHCMSMPLHRDEL